LGQKAQNKGNAQNRERVGEPSSTKTRLLLSAQKRFLSISFFDFPQFSRRFFAFLGKFSRSGRFF